MKPQPKFRERMKSDKPKSEFNTPQAQYNLPKNQRSNNHESEAKFLKRSSSSKIIKPQSKLYQQLQQKLEAIEAKIEQTKVNIYRKNLQRIKLNVLRSQQLQELKKKIRDAPDSFRINKQIAQQTQPDLCRTDQGGLLCIADKAKQEDQEGRPKKSPEDLNIRKKTHLKEIISQEKPEKGVEENEVMSKTLKGLVTNVPEGFQHSFQTNPYSAGNNIYYVSEVVKGYKDKASIVWSHLKTSIELFNHFSQTRIPNKNEIMKRAVNLPVNPLYGDKKTVIFDLDETLIHCTENLKAQHQVELPITFPNGEVITAGINIRPGAVEILQALHEQFQLVVFTASHSSYANVVIDHLDPQKQYIQHRLFREHCYLTQNGVYVKDLRIINRKLKNIVLVDNAAYSYAFQPENGIPIIPYYHGDKDYQLKILGDYIKKLAMCEDVRSKNRETFKLTKYRDFRPNEVEKLVEDLYISKMQ